ncbi:MAG: sugar transferase [Mycobacteriales bacterium]
MGRTGAALPLYGVPAGSPSPVSAVGKRLLDIVLGTVLALIALPIVGFLALALVIVTRANPFFTQHRPGHGGRSFRIVKLRTLPPTTPHYGNKHDLKFDEMPLPWLCRTLRRTHLDELPQLFLVPLGSMSLVGPRPRQADHVESMDSEFDALRRQVRPGCTGLWQISTASTELLRDALPFDLFYLRRASVRLDIWIMLRTVATVLGLARPVGVDDVPAWAHGRGLVPASAFVMSAKAAPVAIEPAPSLVTVRPIDSDSPFAAPIHAPAPVPAPSKPITAPAAAIPVSAEPVFAEV